MNNFRLFLILMFCLFWGVDFAQPAPFTIKLLWKIVVRNNGRMKTIDSTDWKMVNFNSSNSKIDVRFIKETSYFEISLKSLAYPDLSISFKDQVMSFPL